MVCFAARESAQASMLAYYPLGEAGSVTGANNLPVDVVSTHDLLNPIGTATVVPVVAGAPGSTDALSFTPNQGYYYVDAGFLPADNFRVEIWANPTADQNSYLLTLGQADGFIAIGIASPEAGVNNWFATHFNVDWIGAASGTGQTATLNTWTKLGIERYNGVTTLYINDVAQAGSSAYENASVNTGEFLHLGVQPGGSTYFAGALDELTFTAIPEPSGFSMSGLALVGLLRVVRNRRR